MQKTSKIVVFLVVATVVAGGFLFIAPAKAVACYCANGTSMTGPELAAAISANAVSFTWSNQTGQTIAYVHNNTSCSIPLDLASYKMFQTPGAPGWLSSQQFYAESGLINAGPNTTTAITVAVPSSCVAQVDLWYQTAPHQLDDSDPYHNPNNLPYVVAAANSIPSNLCVVCTPNWQTGAWGDCVNGQQTRTVTDTNNCGVTTNKPSTTQSCTVVCNPNWQTGSWGTCVNGQQTRTVTDTNNCGVTTNKPSTTQSCTVACVPLTCNSYKDVALNKPASATANNSGVYGPAMAVDGNPLTGWNISPGAANANPASLTIDLQQEYSTTGYSLQCEGAYGGNSGTINFYNAANQIVQTKNYTGCDYGHVIQGNFTNATNVERVVISLVSAGDNVSVSEFELYSDQPVCGNHSDGCGGQINCGTCPVVCTPNWNCGSWGSCVNGQMTRTCTDSNNCGVLTGKPSETQSCNNPAVSVSCYAAPSQINQNQSAAFIATASGGSGSYTYLWSGACTGTSLTCSNSFSQPGTQTATVIATSGSQTNSATCSVLVNQNNNTCTQNPYQRCNGNYLYFYDSCGNQTSQYCPNGCSNNSCKNNTCTYHSYEQCNGSYLYWYDSCGVQEDSQYCPNGCSGNLCQNNNNTYGNLILTKTVRDLTTGNSGWANSVYANPGDTLMFMITLQAGGNQAAQNVFAKDYFPANLIYQNQLIISGNNSYNNYNNSGNIISGINLGTISAGQTVTITYQAQVAQAQNFAYGTTTLNNSASATSTNTGNTPTASASVIVTRTAVLGASTISTGLTNNFWVDSFILPLALALLGIWMLKSGMFFGIEKWLSQKKKVRRSFKAEKELEKKIAFIKSNENK